MITSPTIAELAKALAAFQGEMPAVEKTGVNPFFKSRYATLDDTWKAARPVLAKHGLSLAQLPAFSETSLTLESVLLHSSGEYISSVMTLSAKDTTAQSVGSAISYARRYSMCAILGISMEDDDGNAAQSQKAQPIAKPVDAPAKTAPVI